MEVFSVTFCLLTFSECVFQGKSFRYYLVHTFFIMSLIAVTMSLKNSQKIHVKDNNLHNVQLILYFAFFFFFFLTLETFNKNLTQSIIVNHCFRQCILVFPIYIPIYVSFTLRYTLLFRMQEGEGVCCKKNTIKGMVHHKRGGLV